MEAAYKAACEMANKGPMDISNPTQFQAFCGAVSRLYGGGSDSQVNVAVNNQVGVVITPEKLEQLRDRLKRLQEEEEQEEKALPTKAVPIPLPEANVDTGKAPSGAPTADQGSILIMPGGEGVRVSHGSQSPTLRAVLEYTPPQPEPTLSQLDMSP
jgi:hypothetical protein